MADLKLTIWSKPGPTYAPRLSHDEWESVRPSITKWVQSNLPHREVLALLLQEYGLKISESQLKRKVKEWCPEGRRARKTAMQSTADVVVSQAIQEADMIVSQVIQEADVSVSRVILEAAVSHRVANPALHAFTHAQISLSDMNPEVLPTLNTIFNRGPERMGFDGPHGRLCMSRAPSHDLEHYRNQAWPLEAMASRLRRMQEAIQQPEMGVREILSTIDLCIELWLISIFIEEDAKATGFHRSAYMTLLSVLCVKVGIFAQPTTKVFGASAMVINYWALGWTRRGGLRGAHLPDARRGEQPEASPWIQRFIGPLAIVTGAYLKETLGWAIREFSAKG